jgi:sarcosine oxidase
MYESNIKNYLPDLNPRCVKSAVCMYTSTPDGHFIIDYHPEFPNQVIVASPCSGHGFKHSMAIGKTLAEMAVIGKTILDISHFRLNRFKI